MENITNGKYYIGQHKTKNPLDNYMGSGHYLIKAFKKNKSSFVKIILFDFDNYDEMNEKEKELVSLNDCYPYNEMSYNLMEGSHNGHLSKESIEKANKTKQLNITQAPTLVVIKNNEVELVENVSNIRRYIETSLVKQG